MEKPPESTEKHGTPAGITGGKRVAHCLTCGHEWYPRDGTTPKPSRCPECKKRLVKWRDLCTPEELTFRQEVEEPLEEPLEIEETGSTFENSAEEEAEIIVEIKPESSDFENKSKNAANKHEAKLEAISTGGNRDPVTLEEIQEKTKGGINGLPFVLLLGVLAAAGVFFVLFRGGKKSSGNHLKKAEAQRQAAAAEQERQRDAARERALEEFRMRGL